MTAHPRHPDTELPPDGRVARWTPARKEAVLVAIRHREISVGQALSRWNLSVEELDSWMAAHRKRGREGLKATAVWQGRLC